MKKILYLGLFLALIAGLSAGALTLVNNATQPTIQRIEKETKEKALTKVLPGADKVTETLINEKPIMAVNEMKKGDELLGYVYELQVQGFADKIKYLVGIDTQGNFTGFEVIFMAETSGYGTRLKTPEFKDRFVSKPIDTKIDTLSGATVSSAPTVEGIQAAVTHFNENYKK